MKKFLLSLLTIPLAVSSFAQCAAAFYDGFESASYSPAWTVAGSQVYSVTTTSPAVGTYRLEGTGGNLTHLTGLTTTFAAATPGTISWWVNPQGTTASTNYFVAGNASVSATNCVVFSYWQGTAGNIRFVASVSYDHPAVAGQWYHIELKNINWSAHTYDIYINNVLYYTSFPFRSATQNDVSRVHLYNYNSGTGIWDDIRLGNPTPISTAAFTNVSCFGGTNGAIDQSVTSGTAPYTYAWSNSATTEDISGLTAGSYSVTVTDNIGCTTTATYVVTEPTGIASTTSQTDVSCFGGNNGTAMVMPGGGTPGYTYSWSSGGTAQTESGLTAGTYSVTITDANACTSIQTVTITEPPALIATAMNNGPICVGNQVTLNGLAAGGTPSHTFNWMPGNFSGMTVTDAPMATTAYTLVATDANGCTASYVTTVVVNQLPVVNLGADTTVCGLVMLDAQNAGSTFLWSTGDTSQMETVSVTGPYSVDVTDANGCSSSDTIVVTIDAMPDAGTILCTGGSDICVGDSVALISSASGSVDWWVMPAAGPFWQYIGSGNPFSPQPPSSQDVGMYYFMAVAMNGVCAPDSSNIITVEVHDAPIIPLSADTMSCSGVVLDAQNAGASYLWSTSDTTQTITAAVSGMYTVWIIDQYGCAGADSIDVTINTPPVVTGMASANPVCADDADVTLTGLPAGGLWTGPGVAGNSFDPSIGAGNQIVMYSYTDTNGCSGSYPLTIVVNACVGISEQPEVAVNVYPNPNSGTFTIQLANAAEETVIEITDAEGRVVKSEQLNNTQAGFTKEISLENEANGIYLMRVTSGTGTSVYRIVVQR